MHQTRIYLWIVLWVSLLLAGNFVPAKAQNGHNLAACQEFAYSTEEDFVTQGPAPADGNIIISDGDLLSKDGVVCMRNRDLLAVWEIAYDLGLDAADIVSAEKRVVAFSTELDDPKGRFKAGDLLTTTGAVIPNKALLQLFQVGHDIGLDGVHFVGKTDNILSFLEFAAATDRSNWLSGTNLSAYLQEYEVDIWFSTEGTERTAATTQILDGNVLSAAAGITVIDQDAILPASVPAGIVQRGIDFGLDALTTTRTPDRPSIRFSTEILYRGNQPFTDGDILRAVTGAVEVKHPDLVAPFEPYARFLGVDALHMTIKEIEGSTQDPRSTSQMYLPLISGHDSQQAAAANQ